MTFKRTLLTAFVILALATRAGDHEGMEAQPEARLMTGG